MQKKTYTLGVSIVLASVMITLFVSPPFSFITWLDTMFALSLIATIIGASLLIVEKDFFGPFIRKFKYFMANINKGRQMADEIEQKQRYSNETQPKKFSITFPCLAAGSILLFLTIFFSIISL